jgi:protein TonB
MANEMFNKWNQPESDDRLELVFEDRNKGYGAFQLRSNYRKSKIIATAIACFFVALLSAMPLINELSKLKSDAGSKKVKVEAKTIDDIKEPEEEKKKDEPPPPEPPKPLEAMQQYTVPEFDPNTQHEADLPPNDKIQNAGNKTQDGELNLFPTGDNNTGDGTFKGDDNKIYEANVQAKFIGGDEGFIAYVKEKFQYPQRCQDEGIDGYVLLRFVVDTKGNVSQVTMLEETASCKEFTDEAIRVLKNSPQWIPGMIGGRFVKSYRVVPIRLNLN